MVKSETKSQEMTKTENTEPKQLTREGLEKKKKKKDASKDGKQKNLKREGLEDNAEDYVDPETHLGEKKRLSCQMAKAYNPSTAENSWYAWWENSNFFIADGSSSKPPFVIVAVEQKLKRERNKTRHDFTRQEFADEVWKWLNEYGDSIQLWRLGASLDWSHEVDHTDIKESTAKRSLYEDPLKFGVNPLEGDLGDIGVATTRMETVLGNTAISIRPDDKRYN